MAGADQPRKSDAHLISGNVIVLRSNSPASEPPNARFDRRELDQLLQLYSQKVALGEWRDYAIDMLKDRAVFSVFKRSSEMPIFMVEKTPKLARKQGAWSVTNASGQILKRGHDLRQVLRVFDKKPRVVNS